MNGDGQPEIVAAAGNAGVVILGRDGKIHRSLRAASSVTRAGAPEDAAHRRRPGRWLPGRLAGQSQVRRIRFTGV